MNLLTTLQAAEILQIGRCMVARHCQSGQLPAEKVGRDWMITPKALETFKQHRPVIGWVLGRLRKPQSI